MYNNNNNIYNIIYIYIYIYIYMAVFSDLGTCRSIDPLQDDSWSSRGLQLIIVSNGCNVRHKLLLDSENWIEADIQYSTEAQT